MINATTDPNPTREFIFGDPFLNTLKPSTSKSAKDFEVKKILSELWLLVSTLGSQLHFVSCNIPVKYQHILIWKKKYDSQLARIVMSVGIVNRFWGVKIIIFKILIASTIFVAWLKQYIFRI